jgi:hypothetical protein
MADNSNKHAAGGSRVAGQWRGEDEATVHEA